MQKGWIISGLAAFLLGACADQRLTTEPTEVTFIDHVKAEMIEQDVFVEREPGSNQVYRVTLEEKDKFLSQPVFTAAETTKHDPMNPEEVGPYPKGRALGFSLAEWLSATGTATVSCEEGKGQLDASFQNLVPNGVYTMWHYFVAWPLTEPFSSYDLPVGDRDGSQSSFVADAQGNAVYSQSFEPCLQGTGNQLIAGVAIAYHSDGRTYGDHPGSFGDVSHVHLFADFPADAEL
jgi:hypothetical protein